MRRVLHVQGGSVSISEESRFASEQDLERAVAAHPEVLPSEDLGLGPLVALGTQLDFGAGPIDLLAVDPRGALAITEFKRGSENPDVRKVVAQLLDYGSSLWRKSYEELEERCMMRSIEDGMDLEELVARRFLALDVRFDEEAFRDGVESSLDAGEFAFVYVGRELDARSRRIMTYLAEGPRIRFFAVEVDYYRHATDDLAVIAPRSAFIPSWITGPATGARTATGARGEESPETPEFAALVDKMDALARELGLRVARTRAGRNYQPEMKQVGVSYTSGIGVNRSSRGAEFNPSYSESLGRTQ